MTTNKVKRRLFLKLTALGSLGSALPNVLQAESNPIGSTKTPASENQSLKFTAFADIHHNPGVFYSQTPEHLEMIQDRAVREKVDLIIHAGDFTHNPPKVMDFVDRYNNFKIPGYHVLGNHDQDGCRFEETLDCYHMTAGHYCFDKKGFRFIIFDPNYVKIDGKYFHYTKSNYYKCADICYVPPEQLEWLAAAIDEAPGPCVMISHQSVEREVGGVKNWFDVRNIINRANEKNPGRVRLVINGHYHRDFIRLLDNVVYFDLNSASYDWIEKTHNLYPKDLCQKYKLINHTVVYNDPIHAVITMDRNGLLKIDGMESEMFLGVDRKKAGVSFADSSGRPVFPRVQSAKMVLAYSR